MAANLLVRRSAARLLCLVRSQVACFTTERSPSSEPFITTGSLGLRPGVPLSPNTAESIFAWEGSKQEVGSIDPYLRSTTTMDTRSIDEILDDDEDWLYFYHRTERYKASADLWNYWRLLMDFGWCLLMNLFKEHLVKHCSHTKIQMDEAFKFKEAFSLPMSDFINGPAKYYYLKAYGFGRKVPMWLQTFLLKELAKEKKELIEGFRPEITDEILREIEDDITKKVNEIIVKEKKRKRKGKERKVNEEMVV